jgi:hypothetical protein
MTVDRTERGVFFEQMFPGGAQLAIYPAKILIKIHTAVKISQVQVQ